MIDVLRLAAVVDGAGAQNSDAVGDGHGLLLIVGDVDGRDADLLLDLLDDGAHLHAELRVQIGQRLVHQQDVRLDDQRTRQRDALLLAAGEAIRHTVGIFIHMDKLQEFIRCSLHLFLGHLLILQAELDIFPDGHIRENRVILKNHTDPALAGIHVVDALIVEIEVAALDRVKASDHSQQRCLAAARRAEQREQLAFFDRQGQTGDDRRLTIFLDRILDRDRYTHKCHPLPFLFFGKTTGSFSRIYFSRPCHALLPKIYNKEQKYRSLLCVLRHFKRELSRFAFAYARLLPSQFRFDELFSSFLVLLTKKHRHDMIFSKYSEERDPEVQL